jgi:hypothetical protein
VDGEYQLTGRSLDWRIPIADKDNRSGTLEFQVRGDDAAVFFPVRIQFNSLQSFCGLSVREVNHVDSQTTLPFTQDIQLTTENFSII